MNNSVLDLYVFLIILYLFIEYNIQNMNTMYRNIVDPYVRILCEKTKFFIGEIHG